MTQPPPPPYPRPPRAPVHFWIVGVLLVLWNCWGLLGAIAAQVHLFPAIPEEVIRYVDQQPLWFMILADFSPLAGVAGAIALLVQSRWAPVLFGVQVGVLALTNLYEVALGKSLLLTSEEARWSTTFLVAILAAQAIYAWRMGKRGLLS